MHVFETRHFLLVVPEPPHISRADGGHLVIHPRIAVEDRTHLTHAQAVDLVELKIVAGSSMRSALARRGIVLGRINYQDNGNWRQELHVQLCGRALDAKLQPYGHALSFPPTGAQFRAQMGHLEPLTAQDAAAIGAEMQTLLATDRCREYGLAVR
jgi:hypothetical protein